MTFTSVPVKPDTLKRLRAYKVGGKSYDEVIRDFMEQHPPEEYWEEHLRRLKEEPDVPWEAAKKRLKRRR